jgi:hypothetical protein
VMGWLIICVKSGPSVSLAVKEGIILGTVQPNGRYLNINQPLNRRPTFQKIIMPGISKFTAQSGLPKMPLHVGPQEAKVPC